jgi:hypothetical protein
MTWYPSLLSLAATLLQVRNDARLLCGNFLKDRSEDRFVPNSLEIAKAAAQSIMATRSNIERRPDRTGGRRALVADTSPMLNARGWLGSTLIVDI